MDPSCFAIGLCPDRKVLGAFLRASVLERTFRLEGVDEDFVGDVCVDVPVPARKLAARLPREARSLWNTRPLAAALRGAEGKGLEKVDVLILMRDAAGPSARLHEVRPFRSGRFMFIGPVTREEAAPQLEPFARYRALAKKHLGRNDEESTLRVAIAHLATKVEAPGQMMAALLKNDPAKWRTSIGVNDVIVYALKHDRDAWKIRQAPDAVWSRLLRELRR